MARSLIAVALVGAVVAIAWFAWREKPALDVASEREVAAPAEMERNARVELSRDLAPVVRPDAPARVATKDDETPITAAPADGLEVIVVDGRSGVPVAGARVRGLGLLEPMSGPNDHKEVPIGLLDFEIELAGGAVYETDATGRTRIPKNGVPGSYAASAPGMWGMAYFSDSERPPHVIDMVPERGARVLVVDAHGKPTPNVPVAIACDGARFDDLVESLSDEQGFVDVRHWRSAQQKCLDAADTCVRPLILAKWDAIPRLHIDTNAGAPDPQRLALPPLGNVEVRVRSADGVALFPRDVVLSRAEDKGYEGRPGRDAEVFAPSFSELGRALFEHVGLGLELRASSTSLGKDFTYCLGPGPQTDRATAVLELVVTRPRCELTGRFVDTGGRPLAGVQGEFQRSSAGDSDMLYLRRIALRTDDAGRFRVFTNDSAGAPSTREVGFVFYDDAGHAHRSIVALPTTLSSPETDLGDIHFASPQPIVSGRVLVPRGMLLLDAQVLVRPIVDSIPVQSTADLLRQRGDFVSVREDGTFDIWNCDTATTWLVHARAGACEGSIPVEVAAGAAGLTLEFGAGGFVRGRLIADQPVAPGRFVVLLQRADDETDAGKPLQIEAASDGRFAFALSAPGTFDLRVADTKANWNEVVVLEGLVLAAGTDCSDPRLDPIDLRGK